MKKLLLSVVLIASAFTFTFAQNAKWSFAPKGGLTYFRITPTDGLDKSFDLGDASWGAGLILERTANPLFGMGLDVSYLKFDRESVEGYTIDPVLFGSVNISNLVFPHRESSVWNVYAKAGAGVGVFTNDLGRDGSKEMENVVSPLFIGAIHPEVALGKYVALGLEVSARYYSYEKVGGIVSKERFDDAMTAMGTLRFNLGANHVRTMTMDQFYPAPEPVVNNVESSYDDSQLVNRLDNLDRQNQNIQNRLTKLENDLQNLLNEPKGTEVNVSFDNIEFDFDSANLTEDSYPVLDLIMTVLNENPTWATLKLKGHTDNVGSEEYNQTLSEERVNSVKEYLVSKGFSEEVISTEGYGETQPVATNDTKEGRQANRRVEFELVK